MDLPPELEILMPKKPKGKKPIPRRTLGETKEIRAFFKSRKIANRRLAEVLGVTGQAVSNWWILGIPESRFPAVKELKDKITQWEEKSGKRFPGV